VSDNGSSRLTDKTHVIIIFIVAWGEYYFNDTPISSEENMPALAKAEFSKKKRNTGSMNW
jgi:hypothetical protein